MKIVGAIFLVASAGFFISLARHYWKKPGAFIGFGLSCIPAASATLLAIHELLALCR